MTNKGKLTKRLAIAGTILAWIPLLAPLVFSMIRLAQSGNFMVDYLMPAEIFPVALAGAGLLIWAALRARSRRRLIGGSLAAAVLLLVASQAVAVVTGLANGDTQPDGWQWALVLTLLAAFVGALIALAAGGLLLLRDLFKTETKLTAV